MRYQHSREESAAILRRALQLMSPHKAGYHPVSYAVWYEHAGELNPALTQDLGQLLAGDRLLSDPETCRLHALHIAGRDVQAFELAQSQLREVLGESEKHAGQAERSVKRFAATLADAVEEVRQQDGEAAVLAEKVARVLTEAAQLQSVLGTLHQQLARQRQEVDHVMQRLERAQNEPLRDPLTGLKNLHGLRGAVEARESAELAGVAFLAVDVDHLTGLIDRDHGRAGEPVASKVVEGDRDVVQRVGGHRRPEANAFRQCEQLLAVVTRFLCHDPNLTLL